MQVEHDRSNSDPESIFRIPERIPVFPLPNVVFFPETFLPLHIFEPRYRAMVVDAVARGQCIGMALLKEGWEQDYHGNPPIFKLGCVGRLVSVERLPDGRFNILLQGLERYEIYQELFEKSYREARILIKPRPPSDSAGNRMGGPLRGDLVRSVDGYLKTHMVRQAHHSLDPEALGGPEQCGGKDEPLTADLLRAEIPDEVLVNSLSGYLDFSPLEKQFLLESDSLLQQARRLLDLLEFKRSGQGGVKGWS